MEEKYEIINETETANENLSERNVSEETENKTSAPTEAELELSAAEKENKVKIMSQGRLVAKRFFRSKLSVIGLVGIIFLFMFSFFGPMFSPYGETEIISSATREVRTIYSWDTGESDPETGERIFMYEIRTATVANKAAPSIKNLLGTDTMGMDVLTRLMYGGRISLLISFIVVFLEEFLGIILGGLAGYFGKWVDNLIMRIVDILNCIPTLPILLIACSILDSWNFEPKLRIYLLMVILTVFGWTGTARLVRGQILMLREQEFMVAAEATGLSTKHKIFKHLLPNVLPQIIVSATLGLGSVILYESTLSYLNLGVPFPYAAWGSMISLASPSAGPEILQHYPNLWIPAGVLIVMAVLSFNFIGDGLRDAFDPKAKK
ncbi:MAG: ABC transporter permease [Clostridia bacterium]|nr:ABC transporter permease [Clostridia bacterium]